MGASADCKGDTDADRQRYSEGESCVEVPTIDTAEGEDLDDVDVDEGEDAEEGDVLGRIRHDVYARQKEHDLMGQKQQAKTQRQRSSGEHPLRICHLEECCHMLEHHEHASPMQLLCELSKSPHVAIGEIHEDAYRQHNYEEDQTLRLALYLVA
jgi:hypothetical protein